MYECIIISIISLNMYAVSRTKGWLFYIKHN